MIEERGAIVIMKKISIVIPCYNEEENLEHLYTAVIGILNNELSEYDYELLIIDNKSKDRSREIIRSLCAKDQHVNI